MDTIILRCFDFLDGDNHCKWIDGEEHIFISSKDQETIGVSARSGVEGLFLLSLLKMIKKQKFVETMTDIIISYWKFKDKIFWDSDRELYYKTNKLTIEEIVNMIAAPEYLHFDNINHTIRRDWWNQQCKRENLVFTEENIVVIRSEICVTRVEDNNEYTTRDDIKKDILSLISTDTDTSKMLDYFVSQMNSPSPFSPFAL